MSNAIDVMVYKYPNRQWSCGSTYESLKWFDQQAPKPTRAEYNQARDEYLQHKARTEYRAQRARAYPTLQRQMIAIIEYLQQTVVSPSPELQRMFDRLDVVKTRYPKP